MRATALFAALHVADIGAARAFYTRLVGREPDLVPNAVEACWTVTDTGWIYLLEDAERAGTSMATVLVDDHAGCVAQLDARGIAHGPVQTVGDGVLTVWVTDRRQPVAVRPTAGDVAGRRVDTAFTPTYRGGTGAPLLLLHGFMDTWRTWQLVLPALERRHDVLTLTLPGHAGGPPLNATAGAEAVLASVERALDAAGWDTAHLAGNSLGGWLALQLAARGRARSVVALAPAGGWAADDPAPARLLRFQGELQAQVAASATHAEAIAATPAGRRRAMELIVTDGSDLPPDLVAACIRGVAGCTAARALTDAAARDGWRLDAERVTCPVRIVWGTADRLLPWPSAAVRYRRDWLPHADWVELDGVGHAPQLEAPLETAQLILGITSP